MPVRAVISAFEAWDSASRNWLTLRTGTVVRNYRIEFNKRLGADGSLNPYIAEFDIEEGRYACALHTFQARTEFLSDTPALSERSTQTL